MPPPPPNKIRPVRPCVTYNYKGKFQIHLRYLMMNQEICVTCKKQLEKDEFVTLGEKGSAGIDIASEERGDTMVQIYQPMMDSSCST